MTRHAHRCQTCGLVLDIGDTRKWCAACQPPEPVRRRWDTDDPLTRRLTRAGVE